MTQKATVFEMIPSGVIPESTCPRCGAPLAVVNKRMAYFGQAPQFVGCTMYPQCGHARTVTPDDRAAMEKVQAERDAMPAEF